MTATLSALGIRVRNGRNLNTTDVLVPGFEGMDVHVTVERSDGNRPSAIRRLSQAGPS